MYFWTTKACAFIIDGPVGITLIYEFGSTKGSGLEVLEVKTFYLFFEADAGSSYFSPIAI